MERKKKRSAVVGGQLSSRREDWQLYSLFIPVAVIIFLFSYVPMGGLVIAFREFRAGDALFAFDSTAKWVGLKHFERFLSSIYFKRLITNTLRLSALNLLFGFTTPIIFALMLNEVRNLRFKKLVQTSSYLPYFVSMVVAAGMTLSFLEVNGVVNHLLALFGVEAKEWIVSPQYFPTIYTIVNVWKTFGFSSILYFSTISSIDPTLYEAAKIDGANRWQQMLHVTLPGITFIIAIQLVLEMGRILNSNTDLILLLYRPSTYSVSDVIGTYVYREGIIGGKYSYTTAVSLFMSLISFAMVYTTNKVSNKLTGHGLW